MPSEVPCVVCDGPVVVGGDDGWVSVAEFGNQLPEGMRTRVRMHVDCADEAAESGWR